MIIIITIANAVFIVVAVAMTTYRKKERQTYRQTERETDRQAGQQTERGRERERGGRGRGTDRQTKTKREIQQRHKHSWTEEDRVKNITHMSFPDRYGITRTTTRAVNDAQATIASQAPILDTHVSCSGQTSTAWY